MLYISFNYRELHRLKEAVFAPHMVNAGQQAVAEICRLLEGSPLAIELASNWLRLMDCSEILAEVKRDFDFVRSNLSDLPERHRSLRSVFDSSVRFLSEKERSALFRASVFPGGFEARAARSVAEIGWETLLSLVDQSWLYRTASGRYDFHALLKRFAAQGLAALPEELRAIERRHCTYFLKLLAASETELRAEGQRVALDRLRMDSENIRAAWIWAVQNRLYPALDHSLHALFLWFSLIGDFNEGKLLLQLAMRACRGKGQLRLKCRLGSRLGRYEILLGRLDRARRRLLKSVSRARDLRDSEELAFALNQLSGLFYHLGDFQQASSVLQESLQIELPKQDIGARADLLVQMSRIRAALGEYEPARECLDQANQLFVRQGDENGVARCMSNLASLSLVCGQLDEATQQFEEALSIFKKTGDPKGIATCLNNSSLAHRARGEQSEARQVLRKAYPLFKKIGYLDAAAQALENLGSVSLALGEHHEARKYFVRSLKMAHRIEAVPVVVTALVGLAELMTQEGNARDARHLIAFARLHPRAPQEARARAEQLEDALKGLRGRAALPGKTQFAVEDYDSLVQKLIRQCEKQISRVEWQGQTELVERRRYRRFPTTVTCEVTWQKRRLPSRGVDVSLGGARLTCEGRLPEENTLVAPAVQRESVTRKWRARIRHIEAQEGEKGAATLGLEFVGPLNQGDLRWLASV